MFGVESPISSDITNEELQEAANFALHCLHQKYGIGWELLMVRPMRLAGDYNLLLPEERRSLEHRYVTIHNRGRAEYQLNAVVFDAGVFPQWRMVPIIEYAGKELAVAV